MKLCLTFGGTDVPSSRHGLKGGRGGRGEETDTFGVEGVFHIEIAADLSKLFPLIYSLFPTFSTNICILCQ